MAVDFAERRGAVVGVLRALVIFFLLIPVAAVAASGGRTVAELLQFPAGSTGFVVLQTVGQFLGFLALGAGFLWVTGDRSLVPVRRPTTREAGVIGGGVLVLLTVQFGLIELFSQFGITIGENRAITVGRDDPVYYLFMIPVSILLVGPGEELIFRGIVQGEVGRATDTAVGIAVATLLFGVVHYSVQGGLAAKLSYVAIVVVLSVLLGSIYAYTDNLVVPALVHGSYNATLFAVQYLDTTGAV